LFGIGMPELVIIFVIALLVFGPKELPKIGRTIGKAMGEFRRASDELREGIQREIELAEREDQGAAPTPPLAEEPPVTAAAETTPPAPQEPAGETRPEEAAAVSVASASSEGSEEKRPSEPPGEPSPQAETAPHAPPRPVETRNA
jgi:TatA/E family protein of Tat protein translocase